jgi:hypothetical protein
MTCASSEGSPRPPPETRTYSDTPPRDGAHTRPRQEDPPHPPQQEASFPTNSAYLLPPQAMPPTQGMAHIRQGHLRPPTDPSRPHRDATPAAQHPPGPPPPTRHPPAEDTTGGTAHTRLRLLTTTQRTPAHQTHAHGHTTMMGHIGTTALAAGTTAHARRIYPTNASPTNLVDHQERP